MNGSNDVLGSGIMGSGINDDLGSGNDCNQLNNVTPHEAFGLTVPNDANWEERTLVWYVFFDLMLATYGLLYGGLALFTLVMLCKRRLTARFKKVHTFVAIDFALLTLGVSRVVFFSLDPWGQNNYFTCQGCVVVSRLISALAFPSLTASYTLLFITLWSTATIKLGPFWIQKLRVLVPLCFVHYIVAIVLEIIGSCPLPVYPIVIVLLLCETIFAVLGIVLCVAFMIAGVRLLRTIKQSARSTSMVCRDSPTVTRHDLIVNKESPSQRYKQRTKSRNVAQERHHRAVRKISRITYFTASLAILYSALIMVNVVVLCLNLFDGCTGYIDNAQLSPERWLVILFLRLTVELLLATLLSYSNTDYRPVISFLKRFLHCTTKTSTTEGIHNHHDAELTRMSSLPRMKIPNEISMTTSQEDAVPSTPAPSSLVTSTKHS